MKSKVYFIATSDKDTLDEVRLKFSRLLDQSGILKIIDKGELVAVKLHFGEEGNTGFVKPQFLRQVTDRIRAQGAEPVLTDTNTLYYGKRTNAKDHLALAASHGFTQEIAGAKAEIADGNMGEDYQEVEVNGKFIKNAQIGKLFEKADAIVGVAHFKGHIMTGFGGALKNIGMGCAARKGKLAQHSDISPIVHADKCVACGACVKVCPAKAIEIINKKANIYGELCIGCASCIAACYYSAIEVKWDSGAGTIQEKMAEYAAAALKSKTGKICFVNFAVKITKECDCLAKDDPKISPDVGIFASFDPVAADKASLDMVIRVSGRDIFKEAHPQRDGMKQLNHAVKMGLGNLEYDLEEVK